MPRKTNLTTLPSRTSPLQCANWRAGATGSSNVLLPISSVRYGSWYAPWSWGRSNTPSDATSTANTTSKLVDEPAPIPEPVVTSTTPELAPAGIDRPAIVDGTLSSTNSRTVEDLLDVDLAPAKDAIPLVDPTATISYWGNLKDLGLDYGWGTSALFENLVELSYLNTELGWTGSIALSALAIRCGLFYFQIQGSDAGAKLAAMKPVLQPIMDEMEAAKRDGNEERVQACKRKQKAIMGEVGGALWKTLSTPALQMVLGFGAFRCLRGMTSLPVPGMNTEGLWWFTDLTVSDPLYILPLATGGIMYTIIKVCQGWLTLIGFCFADELIDRW
jgi:YidC/Oxa1 family membrane protein insertase